MDTKKGAIESICKATLMGSFGEHGSTVQFVGSAGAVIASGAGIFSTKPSYSSVASTDKKSDSILPISAEKVKKKRIRGKMGMFRDSAALDEVDGKDPERIIYHKISQRKAHIGTKTELYYIMKTALQDGKYVLIEEKSIKKGEETTKYLAFRCPHMEFETIKGIIQKDTSGKAKTAKTPCKEYLSFSSMMSKLSTKEHRKEITERVSHYLILKTEDCRECIYTKGCPGIGYPVQDIGTITVGKATTYHVKDWSSAAYKCMACQGIWCDPCKLPLGKVSQRKVFVIDGKISTVTEKRDVDSLGKAGMKIQEFTDTYIESSDHDGKTCAQIKTEQKLSKEIDPTQALIASTTIPCPGKKCGTRISRKDGCNTMECTVPSCGAWFCYSCGKECPFTDNKLSKSKKSDIAHGWLMVTCGIWEEKGYKHKKEVEEKLTKALSDPKTATAIKESVGALHVGDNVRASYETVAVAILGSIGMQYERSVDSF